MNPDPSLTLTSLGLSDLIHSLEETRERAEDPNYTDHDSSPDGCSDSCSACVKAQRLSSHILTLEDALEVVEIYRTIKPR